MAETGINKQHLIVRIGAQWYGVPLSYVVEVLHLVALNDLPGTEPHILGLMTLREHIMPVIDMRLLFAQPEAPLKLNTPMVALHDVDNHRAVLVVDEVDDVMIFSEDLQPQADSDYIAGAIQRGERFVMVLDIPYLLTTHASVMARAVAEAPSNNS